jgi:hypothetical protein
MAGGIDITACYRILCDWCRVEAEPGVEYHTMTDAHAARDRVARFDGWLLRIDGHRGEFTTLTCPECTGSVGPPE